MLKKTAGDGSGQERVRGQALIEVAVFGAIFLILLGSIISFGLTYNFNQQAQMRAFRTALKIASDEQQGTGTYIRVEDRHIPDPQDELGVGRPIQVVASASVTRDINADWVAADYESLPGVVMDYQTEAVNGQPATLQRRVYKTSGFRDETLPKRMTTVSVHRSWWQRLWDRILNRTVAVVTKEDDQYNANLLMKYRLVYGIVEPQDDTNTVVKIHDVCSGQVPSYATCYEQALKMVNQETCRTSCELGKSAGDTTTDCGSICSTVMNPPNQSSRTYNSTAGGAWYAAEYYTDSDTGKIRFPVLEALFEEADLEVDNNEGMGLQGDATIHGTRSSFIRKMESPGSIQAEMSVRSATTIDRTFVQNNNLGSSDGYEIKHSTARAYLGHVQTIPITSEVVSEVDETWTTEK